MPTLSKLPTMDESGFKGFEVGIWHGMWVPKGTPKPVVDKLIKSLQAGLADPKFQDRMKQLGATVLTSDATRRRWTPRSSSRCRSGPSCSRRRASSSKAASPAKKAPFAGKGAFEPLIRAGADALEGAAACRAQAQPRNVSACRLSPLAPPETGGS